jgi:hypothetical protein
MRPWVYGKGRSLVLGQKLRRVRVGYWSRVRVKGQVAMGVQQGVVIGVGQGVVMHPGLGGRGCRAGCLVLNF